MLTSSNFKMTFSFAITGNIAITTLKLVNKVGAEIGNKVLEFEQMADSVDFSVTIPNYYKDVYTNSFFPRKAKLLNYLPIECFPLINDLSGFKSRINRHLLTVGYF